MEAWRNARWLAWRDIREARLSFPANALAGLLIGFFAGFMLYAALDPSEPSTLVKAMYSTIADFYFVLLAPGVLTTNFLFNREFMLYWRTDYLSKRLHFLRSLPICVREMVASRLLVAVLTVVVTAPFLFAAFYPSADLTLGPAQYFWFVVFWLGYALFAGMANMYCWLAVGGRTNLWIAFGAMAVTVLFVGTLNLVFGLGLLAGSVGLVEAHGPVVAVPMFLLGLAGLPLWGWLMERRLRRRDLSA